MPTTEWIIPIWHICPSWAACFHVPLGRFSKNPVKCYVEPKLAAREHFEILHSCCPVPADGWSNKGICIYDHLCTIPTSIELRPKLGNLLLQADVGASWGGSRSIPLQQPSPSDGYLSPRFLRAIWSIWSIWEQKQTKQSCMTTFTISSVLSVPPNALAFTQFAYKMARYVIAPATSGKKTWM